MKNRIFTLLAVLCAACVAGCSDDDTDGAAARMVTPTNVRMLNRTESSLTFTWDIMPEAKYYQCELTNEKDVVLASLQVADNRVTITKLAELKPFNFRVRSGAKGSMPSAYSDWITAQTGESLPELAAPVASFKGASTSTVDVEWTAVAQAVGYEYRLLKDDEIVDMGTTTQTSCSFADLQRNTEYLFRVKAVADSQAVQYSDSPFSEDLLVSTEAGTVDGEIFRFPNEEKTDGITRAFPGAEGAGMYTTGGRGGKVYHVTNLDDSGEGSLRAAVEASGKRIVVFDVAGIINLKSELRIKNGDITIAGQTAPGDGICLRYYSMVVAADNVIVRYMRFRPGVLGDVDADADGLDAIWGRYRKNVIVDHCSMSWSTDECSSWYTNKNFTMQWCVLTESLHNAGHTKGSHGYGAIWGGAPASFHHNLVANHDSRNPRFDSPNTYAENNSATDISLSDRAIDFRNNVVYNFCNFPAYGGEGAKLNFVGNTYKWGPASVNGSGKSYKDGKETDNPGYKRSYFYQVDGKYTTGGKTYDYGAASIYCDNSNAFDTSVDPSSTVGAALTADNKSGFQLNASTLSDVNGGQITWLSAPLAISYGSSVCDVTTHGAASGFDKVIGFAGASKQRDAVDERATSHAKAGTYYKDGSNGSRNGIIDLPGDVGGYPDYSASGEEKARVKDSDGDGIPDYYEELFGLDKNNAEDAAKHNFDERYSNLEMYLHYLVQDITLSQVQGGTHTTLN